MEEREPRTHGMQARTIKTILGRKVRAWLKSIDDVTVRDAVKNHVIVTGGSIASLLTGEKVNDFDIYLRDANAALKLAQYYAAKVRKVSNLSTQAIKVKATDDRVQIYVQSAGVASDTGAAYQYFEDEELDAALAGEYVEAALKVKKYGDEKYGVAYVSSNCITLHGDIQVVLRFIGEPDVIHENYDFAHCTNYWCSWDNQLVLRPEAMEALLSRTLVYRGSKYPLCSIIRTRKFIGRGWRINAGQYVKMAMQLNELDLTDVEVLQEQLTGVDVAYFTEVINLLKQGASDGKQIDETYICEIIDRLF